MKERFSTNQPFDPNSTFPMIRSAVMRTFSPWISPYSLRRLKALRGMEHRVY